ncbi:MAG: hypothetical protein DGJ47_000262 [Rickettsiaceae bacterium]
MQHFQKSSITKLEAKLDYQFQNYDLIEEALSHPSLKQHTASAKNYEKLEILGDSILGFLATEMIFHSSEKLNEGDIAKIKAHIVSREVISKVAKQINLAQHIIMTPGEEKSGGRINASNLENSMEALIAAIYLDSNISTTQKIVRSLWSKHMSNIDLNNTDPKSQLQELCHKELKETPQYKVINRHGEDHSPLFEVEVRVSSCYQTAKDNSVKKAEKRAAKLLIQQLISSKD